MDPNFSLHNIQTPKFQKLAASRSFRYRRLEEVGCNLCGDVPARFLFTEGPFRIQQCDRCKLIYVSPQPSAHDLSEYYRTFYTLQSTPEDWFHDRSFAQIKEIVHRHMPMAGNKGWLEIGSGYGYLLRFAREVGFQTVVGVEADTSTQNADESRAEGIRVIHEPFDDLVFEEGQFSFVALISVLEHFKDPKSTLLKCHYALQKGCILILRVPYLEVFFHLNHLLGRNWVPFGAPRHLFDFSPASIQQILTNTGFKVLEIIPGEAELSENYLIRSGVAAIKRAAKVLWRLSGKRYFLPFLGSLVVVAVKDD